MDSASASTLPASELTRDTFSVLIVDDNEAILRATSDVLEASGYRCRCASSGPEALKTIDDTPPDLIITDIKMPEMSGIEMAERVHQSHPATQIMFMTSHAELDNLTSAIKLRPHAYIEKPFTLDELRSEVEKAFECERAARRREEQIRKMKDLMDDKTRELEFRTERLMVEKEMMHGIISNANFGLVAVDTMQSVHLMNPHAAGLLGAAIDANGASVGESLLTLLPNELGPGFIALSEQIAADGPGDGGALSRIMDYRSRRLDVIAYPIRFRERIAAIVYIIHDITEKEQLQQRLLQTAKLASIGELAAGVAHEINNPLGFVTSNCRSLADHTSGLSEYIGRVEDLFAEKARPDQKDFGRELTKPLRESLDVDYIIEDIPALLEETLDGLDRVSKIVSDLKTFARVDREIPEKGQINSLVENALNLVRNEIKYKLEVEKELGELPEIPCFPNQLVQVFTNLFINASHAVDEKGTLWVWSRLEKDRIMVGVRDNGAGIPEDILPRIFDPFFTTKEPGKGTGMGLSISFGIIESHGGTISVESTIGEGTEFVVSLPATGILQQEETH